MRSAVVALAIVVGLVFLLVFNVVLWDSDVPRHESQRLLRYLILAASAAIAVLWMVLLGLRRSASAPDAQRWLTGGAQRLGQPGWFLAVMLFGPLVLAWQAWILPGTLLTRADRWVLLGFAFAIAAAIIANAFYEQRNRPGKERSA